MKAPAPGIIPCCLVAKTGQKALTLNTGTIIITSALRYADGSRTTALSPHVSHRPSSRRSGVSPLPGHGCEESGIFQITSENSISPRHHRNPRCRERFWANGVRDGRTAESTRRARMGLYWRRPILATRDRDKAEGRRHRGVESVCKPGRKQGNESI